GLRQIERARAAVVDDQSIERGRVDLERRRGHGGDLRKITDQDAIPGAPEARAHQETQSCRQGAGEDALHAVSGASRVRRTGGTPGPASCHWRQTAGSEANTSAGRSDLAVQSRAP